MTLHNRTQFLGEAESSIRNQSYPTELVVIDSSDKPLRDLVRAEKYIYAPDDESWPPYVSKKWNRAIRVCAGDYVAFIDDDDAKAPDFLSTLVPKLEQNPALDAVACCGNIMDETSNVTGPTYGFGDPPSRSSYLRKPGYFITMGHFLIRRTVFWRKMFDEALGVSEDYDFVLRLMDGSVEFLHDPLVFQRAYPGRLSANPRVTPATQFALRRILKKYGVISECCTRCGVTLPAREWMINLGSSGWDILCFDCEPKAKMVLIGGEPVVRRETVQ